MEIRTEQLILRRTVIDRFNDGRFCAHLWYGIPHNCDCSSAVVFATVLPFYPTPMLDRIDVADQWRREGYATETVRALRDHYGALDAIWISESGAHVHRKTGVGKVSQC